MYKTVSVNNADVLKAFTCSTSIWQTYQCTQKVPGATGSELIWVEVPIDSKILVNQKARVVADLGKVKKAVHTPVNGGTPASDSTTDLTKVSSFLIGFPQIRYSEFAPAKDTTYKDF